MYKVLIIDDEYLVRVGLKDTIDWASFGAEIVGEATNGKQGFQLALQLQPDLIITDVKMPVMNGVELASKLKQHNFQGRVIVLSGYSDFEYARSTFESGVSAYVLKPVDNDELVKTVKETLAELEKSRSESALFKGLTSKIDVVRLSLIRDILIGNIVVEEEIKSNIELFELRIPEQGYVVEIKIDNNDESRGAQLAKLNKVVASSLKIQDVFLFENFLIFMYEAIEEKQLLSKLQQFLLDFEKEANFAVSIGYATYGRLNQIHEAYKQVQKIVATKLLIGINTISGSKNALAGLKKPVADAIQYIADHYFEELSVKKVADAVNVSESHLMHLFKDNINRTFNEVLTTYRMHIAKKILRSKKYRVNEVASMVGYKDPKYFSTVFSKTFDILPSEYMENY